MKQNKPKIQNGRVAQKHREWVTIALTSIKGDLEHIKEKVNANERHLSKQNDRISKVENSISKIQGVGGILALLFTSLFGYFFNKN
jgi:predicted  nucleic acid-binding Zn-ribbon protein